MVKRIKKPMFRYGEADFDAGYLRWGLHDPETQAEEARSVLRIAGDGPPLRILDLACGAGAHAVHWAREGHEVTAVDLSETFVARGRQAAREEGLAVEFIAADVTSLPCRGGYDLW